MSDIPYPFDAETWAQLPGFFDNLPNPVHIHLWGEPVASQDEKETAVLCQTLADHFHQIQFRQFPRRINYPFYPVLGFMVGEEETDFGVRIIGWPRGMQLTTLIAAIQTVSFGGVTLEPITRIKLKQLETAVDIEIVTAAPDEGGAVVAKHAFGLSVAHPQIRTFVIMGDRFHEALLRFSVTTLPHIIINDRHHHEGVVSEDELLQLIARAVKT